jgi:unconventional prefoldin RPB5 interactor 1
MAVRHATLDELERRRLELEGNIQTLRRSLYDWRLREAEYDGLKDKIKNLQHDCTSAEILQAGLAYEGTVVDEKEVRDIIGEKQNITRSRDQVVSQITRRLEYVKQNVASLEKRLSAAEAELDRLLFVERPGPNAATEEYAVTEIFEELDENGEVISSKVSNPADRAPEIIDMLKKAGVEVPQGQEPGKQEDNKVDAKEDGKAQSLESVTDAAFKKEHPKQTSTASAAHAVADTITHGLDESDSEPPVLEVDESPEHAKLRREMLEYSFHEVGRVVAELEMDEEGSELSVDEDLEYDDDDYEEDEDEYGRTTTTVLTEEYHQQMKELEQRLKAGGFINLGPAKNIDAEAKETAEAASHGGVLKVTAIERDANNEIAPEEKKKPKKKVAFAEELDIAEESTRPAVPEKTERKIDVVKSDVTPLSESIVERSASKSSTNGKETTDIASARKKTSRFRSARKDGTPTPGDSTTAGLSPGQSSILKKSDQPSAPSSLSLFPAKPEGPKPFSQPIIAGDVFAAASATKPSIDREAQPPEGKITAETLVERPVTDEISVLPPDPDEIDEEIHRKEVATEFYRRRNLKIQQSGGFLEDDDEDETNQLYELDENDKPVRKVSKFKAARLRS